MEGSEGVEGFRGSAAKVACPGGPRTIARPPAYWVSVNRRLMPMLVFALGKEVLMTGVLITRS